MVNFKLGEEIRKDVIFNMSRAMLPLNFQLSFMALRTLKKSLRKLKLRRRMPSFDMDVVQEQIMSELSGPGCQGG